MAGLQRSEISFRRQGSSGLVWDDKLISEELNKSNKPESKSELRRSRSDGGGRRHRVVKVDQMEDPPSPRVSACGFCSVFGRPASGAKKTSNRKSGKVKA
ncbi:hypothetical protein RND81_08G062300 [Saponaria officinalis]|uniref:MAPK kinase substrate protein n=1 Tax=Saponaria officinalis TaxID=3572 RepID=A0AAW1J319_SAPOF